MALTPTPLPNAEYDWERGKNKYAIISATMYSHPVREHRKIP
jgi:hypothetical protein